MILARNLKKKKIKLALYKKKIKNKFYKLQWVWILKYKDINKVICFDYLQKKVKKKQLIEEIALFNAWQRSGINFY
jgi:hypothetical protein